MAETCLQKRRRLRKTVRTRTRDAMIESDWLRGACLPTKRDNNTHSRRMLAGVPLVTHCLSVR